MKKLTKFNLVAAGIIVAASAAVAQNSTFKVQATVPAACTFGTIGNLTIPDVTNAQGASSNEDSLSINCNTNTGYQLSVEPTDGSQFALALSGNTQSTHTLSYDLKVGGNAVSPGQNIVLTSGTNTVKLQAEIAAGAVPKTALSGTYEQSLTLNISQK